MLKMPDSSERQIVSVGIVGSRRRNTLADRKIVFDLVKKIITENPDKEIVIVSGGCRKGADNFAEEAAKVFGLRTKIFPVSEDPPIESKWEFTKRAFARNKLIAEASIVTYALVHPSRNGGTENTVKHCKDLKKKYFLVDTSGNLYVDPE